jgi:hypothetical protein
LVTSYTPPFFFGGGGIATSSYSLGVKSKENPQPMGAGGISLRRRVVLTLSLKLDPTQRWEVYHPNLNQ